MKRREFLMTAAGIAGAWRSFAATAEAAPCGLPVSGEAALADRIRRAAIGRLGTTRPLPLASHWNTGYQPDGFDPVYQLEQFRQGRYLLPWFQLPRPDGALPEAYYDTALREWARLKLPISFVSTQWEVLVAEAQSGAAPWGKTEPLSPTSSPDAWYLAGRQWGASRLLRRLQAAYPDPPLVLFISNNEQPRLSWPEVRTARLRLPGWTPGGRNDDLRRAVGNAWILRYRELLRGFREGLTSAQWRACARFAGYDAFGQFALGRWPGWPEHSLHTTERYEPWSTAWDGASVSYYTSDWNPSSDFRVWSPQIEAMNLVPMLEQVRHDRADFWFELSTWDGQSDGLKDDKDTFYRSLGQRWSPQRYAGMVQFGMWLLRPRVVREFRDPQSPRSTYGSYFDVLQDAIANVHENAVFARFWRNGRLVSNSRSLHPYQSAIPGSLQAVDRWYLLETSANPPRPWNLDTEIVVFALALELGRAPEREWLIYAHSPRVAEREVQVTLTTALRPLIGARQGGAFSLVREAGGGVESLQC
jgi:hypothetical protein